MGIQIYLAKNDGLGRQFTFQSAFTTFQSAFTQVLQIWMFFWLTLYKFVKSEFDLYQSKLLMEDKYEDTTRIRF